MGAVFNILLFELLAWIFVSVTGKIRCGLRIELVTAMIYGIANAYVVRFRTNPIVPWDIFSWKTAASVASNYDFKPDTRMVVVTLVFLGMIVLLQFVKTGIPKFQLWKRLIPAGVCCIVLVLFVNLLQDEDFQTGHRLYPFLFTPAFMTQVNGVAVTFAMDLAYMTVEKPAGYDAVKEQALLESYAGQEDDTDSSEKKEGLPNIIVVMNESFSDLNVLGDFTTNEDYMPYLHSLQNGAENTVTGYLNVSVCGGNTANTEFEFLTGNSMAFLPQGSIPYQQYITKELPASRRIWHLWAMRRWQPILIMRMAGTGIRYIHCLAFQRVFLKISTGEQVMCASTSVIIAVWIRSLNYMRKKKREHLYSFSM